MTTKDFSVLTSSNSNEWHTPPHIIDLARRLMGGIDIDPASNPEAQEWIQAKVYYRKHQDGFNKLWYGRLWLNPPFGKRSLKEGNYGAGAWFHKAYAEYKSNRITEALVLGRGDSEGLKLLTKEFYFCDCDRLNFLAPGSDGESTGVPGTRIFYLGNNVDGFIHLFKSHGTILRAVS